MTAQQRKGISPWLWGILVIALGTVVGLLVLSDRRQEPSEAFRYDIAKFREVEAEQVLFKEVAKLQPGLEKLSALAIAPDGRILVAGDKTIVIFDSEDHEQGRIPIPATPDCMAVAPDGTIFLGMRDSIHVLSAEGKLESTWPKISEKSYITSIAAGEKEVYVADAGQRVVLRFDREAKLLQRIGEADETREIPGFIVPSPYFDVAFDTQGALWAVNPGRHGLEHYRPNGDLVAAWYRPTMDVTGFCGCCNPSHVAFRSDGTLVTTEKGLSRVKLYSPDQAYAGLVAAPGAFEESVDAALSCELETPLLDLAVDTRDRVLVIDERMNAVRIFQEKKKQS